MDPLVTVLEMSWTGVHAAFICIWIVFFCRFALCLCSFICTHTHRALLATAHQSQPLPQTLSVLESTPQVRGLHTIIRWVSYESVLWSTSKEILLLNVNAHCWNVFWNPFICSGCHSEFLTCVNQANDSLACFTLFSASFMYSSSIFLFVFRNKDTSRDEFIFYSKRLMRLLIEHALSFLPSKVCGCFSVCMCATQCLFCQSLILLCDQSWIWDLNY